MSSYSVVIIRNRGEQRHEHCSGFSDFAQMQRCLYQRAHDPDFVQAIVITTNHLSGTTVSVLDRTAAQMG